MHVAAHDGARSAAVAAQHCGRPESARGDELADGAVDGSPDAGDDARFDMIDQMLVHAEKRRGKDGQVADAHFRAGVDHLIDHGVAVAQMMVEGDGHAAFQAGRGDGGFEVGQHLVGAVGVGDAQTRTDDIARRLKGERAAIRFDFSVSFDKSGDVPSQCVERHGYSPSFSRPALTRM